MSRPDPFPAAFLHALRARFGADARPEELVPPVFLEMQAQILSFDPQTQTLTVRVPNPRRYQNPYRVMQGGMIAAAIDNAIGPLSVAAAPPNLTRELTIKYKKAISEEFSHIIVRAWVEKLDPPYLFLAARVESEQGELFARAAARHFILPATDDAQS
jgi:acyl-coenzyme A thioesterase PaaI-like protein